jgi:hypothetical protein
LKVGDKPFAQRDWDKDLQQGAMRVIRKLSSVPGVQDDMLEACFLAYGRRRAKLDSFRGFLKLCYNEGLSVLRTARRTREYTGMISEWIPAPDAFKQADYYMTLENFIQTLTVNERHLISFLSGLVSREEACKTLGLKALSLDTTIIRARKRWGEWWTANGWEETNSRKTSDFGQSAGDKPLVR